MKAQLPIESRATIVWKDYWNLCRSVWLLERFLFGCQLYPKGAIWIKHIHLWLWNMCSNVSPSKHWLHIVPALIWYSLYISWAFRNHMWGNCVDETTMTKLLLGTTSKLVFRTYSWKYISYQTPRSVSTNFSSLLFMKTNRGTLSYISTQIYPFFKRTIGVSVSFSDATEAFFAKINWM